MIGTVKKIRNNLQSNKQPFNGSQYEIIIIGKILDLLHN
jgi:hypothetical protein